MRFRANVKAAAVKSSRIIPTFLRPALPRPPRCIAPAQVRENCVQKRQIRIEARHIPTVDQPVATPALLELPLQCPGCGAYTQSNIPENAGYYSVTRKSVRAYLAQHRRDLRAGSIVEEDLFRHAANDAEPEVLAALGLTEKAAIQSHEDVAAPVCNRCHNLQHHHAGVPIGHPSLESFQDILSESPYKYNHVYHVLDAADFPLSLVPRLQHYLELSPQRSYNRRSAKSKFRHGRRAEMSFIITRSDLLAPKKEQVDSLMPYLTQVLRDALGSSGRDVRLGNVRCVSSKRGWWTKNIKEDVWERGGGGWMVGKVNVGKSNLFECIFPKGRTQDVNFQGLRRIAVQSTISNNTAGEVQEAAPPAHKRENALLEKLQNVENEASLDDLLLPPVPPEKQYPVMPTVSSLPGTTASPIRLLFGGGKGELIDLPGLARDDLEEYVSEEHKQDLVMKHRVKPEKFSVKTGQSLLLGGIIRITPNTPGAIILAYPFVPLSGHVTSTEKAIAIQTQQQHSGIPSVAKPGVGQLIASAGVFQVDSDVTKQRAGPLTAPAAVGLKAHRLPFVVYSTDILIEGCGWVELVVQVRRKDVELRIGSCIEDGVLIERELAYPEVEIFSPRGRHIGSRRPMNGWLLGGDKPVPARQKAVRPRRCMKGVKNNSKRVSRAQVEF